MRGEYNNRSQSTSSNLQERCCNAVTENTMNSQNTPIQNQNHIQPGLDLFITYWFSRQNHNENKDEEIPGMLLNIDTIQTMTNIPDCMTIQQLQQGTSQDDHLQQLKCYIIRGWPENKDQIPQDMQTYWKF